MTNQFLIKTKLNNIRRKWEIIIKFMYILVYITVPLCTAIISWSKRDFYTNWFIYQQNIHNIPILSFGNIVNFMTVYIHYSIFSIIWYDVVRFRIDENPGIPTDRRRKKFKIKTLLAIQTTWLDENGKFKCGQNSLWHFNGIS